MADDNEYKVYVGSLNFKTTEEGLSKHFQDCGTVTEARVITDRDSGRSRGFAFVTFQTSDSFQQALDLNGSELDGRTITVSKANARTGGSRGGGGGYSRGGRREYGAGGGQFGGGGGGYGYNQGSYGGSGGGYGGGRRHGGADYSGGGGGGFGYY